MDKFVGDAVMAVFRGQGHLSRALEACLAARQQLRTLAFRWRRAVSLQPWRLASGVDSGEVISGSIGAQAVGRLDYTVLGDVVNTAAWLASLAGKDQILMREALSSRLEAGFEFLSRGTRQLPGAGGVVSVLEVVHRRAEVVTAADSTASVGLSRTVVPPVMAAKEQGTDGED